MLLIDLINNLKCWIKQKDRERILSPFKAGVNANDAQSYITLEEWIRRIAASGELDKYAGLIQSLTDDTPIDKIDWSKLLIKFKFKRISIMIYIMILLLVLKFLDR